MTEPIRATFLASYLAPLHPLLTDPAIVEVAINPDGRVWVERQGAPVMDPEPHARFGTRLAQDLANAIASDVNVPLSAKRPLVSGKITVAGHPVRVQVIAPPAVEGGPSITFRRYSQDKLALPDIGLLHGALVDLDENRRARARQVRDLARDGQLADALRLCINDRLNIVVSGGTSTGKTTFARALLDLVSPDERLVTIEDAFELFPAQLNTVALRSDRAPTSERSPARLLEASLRMRPDRIILGELRGTEATTFLEALNTGHGGSVTTIHADTALKAIDRIAMMVLGAGINMTFDDVRTYCAQTVEVVVQLGRVGGKRGVQEVWVTEVEGDGRVGP